MRLTPRDVEIISKTISEYVGETQVWLFGSRTDDAKRGGDVDLYVEAPTRINAIVKATTRGALMDRLERHVDLVVNDDVTRPKPIFDIAKKTGIRLYDGPVQTWRV